MKWLDLSKDKKPHYVLVANTSVLRKLHFLDLVLRNGICAALLLSNKSNILQCSHFTFALTTIILLIIASAVVELWWWSLLHNWLVTTKDRETFFYFFAAADIAQIPQCTIKVPCHHHHHHIIIISPVPAWWDNIHPNLLTHNPLVPFGQICHCCLITIFVTDRTKTPGPHQIGLMKD